MKLLIVEDEPDLLHDIVSYHEADKFICETAASYTDAAEKIDNYEYDCILLDLTLPGGNGIDLLERIGKAQGKPGLIIISARQSLHDKLTGLKNGADDYLLKPFHLAELLARVQSVIRRRKYNNNNLLISGDLQIDLAAKTAIAGNQMLDLTRKEFDLLLFFIGNQNRVLSKNMIAEHLSGDMADLFDNHDFVYAHIKNLKKKLAAAGCSNHLKTIYGTGYKWTA